MARNDILALVYEVLQGLRKWLQHGADGEPPTAGRLMAAPSVESLLSKVVDPMIELTGAASPPADSVRPFEVLRCVLQALVTEAWIAWLRKAFARELERSLEEFLRHLAHNRTVCDDWRDDVDGGVVLYDFFRPNLLDPYRTAWSKWNADVRLIGFLTSRLQELDEAATTKGRPS